MNAPGQFATTAGTLLGATNGVNRVFTYNPYPTTFLYSVPNAIGNPLVFRNGLLQDDPIDYHEDRGPTLTFPFVQAPDDVITARVYQNSGGATRLRLDAGIALNGAQSIWISVQPGRTTLAPFMLFRNGQLLTNGADYSVIGPWITLISDQAIQPTDIFIALIGTGGVPASTQDGSITGTIDGFNAFFTLPAALGETMLFRNGQLLTEVLDYIQSGVNVQLLGSQIPQPSDTLTAQIWPIGGPIQITTNDGTLYFQQSVSALLFEAGWLQEQPEDGEVEDNTATFIVPPQFPVIVEAWTPDPVPPADPFDSAPFNLPRQFSTDDGTILGQVGNQNAVFTLVTDALITGMLFAWQGSLQDINVDYVWTCLQPSSAGPWVTTITMLGPVLPKVGDRLTVEAFMS